MEPRRTWRSPCSAMTGWPRRGSRPRPRGRSGLVRHRVLRPGTALPRPGRAGPVRDRRRHPVRVPVVADPRPGRGPGAVPVAALAADRVGPRLGLGVGGDDPALRLGLSQAPAGRRAPSLDRARVVSRTAAVARRLPGGDPAQRRQPARVARADLDGVGPSRTVRPDRRGRPDGLGLPADDRPRRPPPSHLRGRQHRRRVRPQLRVGATPGAGPRRFPGELSRQRLGVRALPTGHRRRRAPQPALRHHRGHAQVPDRPRTGRRPVGGVRAGAVGAGSGVCPAASGLPARDRCRSVRTEHLPLVEVPH